MEGKGTEFASPDFDLPSLPGFAKAVRDAVEAGLASAAILDAKGKPVAVAGLDADEARAIAAHVTRQVRTPDSLKPPRSGGSSSGPAELPLVEVGMTIRRRDPN
jgi:hypothetical protein